MAGLRESEIHQSLVRPQMVLGAERELALLAIMITAFIGYCAYLSFNLILAVIAVFTYVFSIGVLRRMFKTDPLMFGNYRKHIRYKSHYKAHSTPFRNNQ